METIAINTNDTLADAIKKLREASTEDVRLVFQKNCKIYVYSMNLKVLQGLAGELRKSITFDVENEKHKEYIESANTGTLDVEDTEIEMDSVVRVEEKVLKGKRNLFSFLPSLSIPFKKKSAQTPRVMKAKKPHTKTLLILAVVLFLILSVAWLMYWLIPSARIVLNVQSDVLVKLLEIRAISGQTEISEEISSIPAYAVSVTEEGSASVPATGSKETGEKAKGVVKIVNKTDKDVSLKKGEELTLISTSKKNMKYVITQSTTIEKQTVETKQTDQGEVQETVYSSSEAPVEALAIGEDYNVDEGQKFSINDYDTDELIAENEKKISGGTKKVVTVADEKNISEAQKVLEADLTSKIKAALQKKVIEGQILEEASVAYEPAEIELDYKAGDETETVTAKGSLSGTGLAYTKIDLDDLVSKLAKTIVPQKYELNDADLTYETAVSGVSPDGKTLTIQVKLRSSITPELSVESIRSDLAGASLDEAQKYLKGIDTISSYEIHLSPRMPFLLQRIPRRQKNIVIEVNK